MRNQILLVVLQFTKNLHPNERIFEHLGIGYVTAYLREQGYSVQIFDQNLLQLDLEQIVQKVIAEEPALIGVACYQEAYQTLQEFTLKVKDQLPQTHICLGGVFGTNCYQHILKETPALDSVVLGDGEETFATLANALFNNQDWQSIPHLTYYNDLAQSQKTPKYNTDITKLPDPARDTLPIVLERNLFPTISASRGCYGNCSYCSITIQNRKRRCRNMISVVDEMERLYKDYRADYFYFIDDTFIGGSKNDYQRIVEFAQELEKRKLPLLFSIECRANEVDRDLLQMLKNVGLYSVFLGLESGYQPTLDRLRKGITVEQNLQALKILTELGIKYTIGFIMFHPYTTLEEIAANIKFLMHTEQKNFLDSLHRRLMVFYNAPIATDLQQIGIQCNPWHSTAVPFLNPEIEPIFNFIENFTARIKPGINQLAVYYSQATDTTVKAQIAKLHSTLCSDYVDTILQYTKNPEDSYLKTRWDYLNNLYHSTIKGLGLSFD